VLAKLGGEQVVAFYANAIKSTRVDKIRGGVFFWEKKKGAPGRGLHLFDETTGKATGNAKRKKIKFKGRIKNMHDFTAELFFRGHRNLRRWRVDRAACRTLQRLGAIGALEVGAVRSLPYALGNDSCLRKTSLHAMVAAFKADHRHGDERIQRSFEDVQPRAWSGEHRLRDSIGMAVCIRGRQSCFPTKV